MYHSRANSALADLRIYGGISVLRHALSKRGQEKTREEIAKMGVKATTIGWESRLRRP